MEERHKHIWLPQPCTVLPAAPQYHQRLNATALVRIKFPRGLRPPARTDVLGAGVTVLGVQGLEAAAAVGPPILHDVALPPQDRLTLKAAEMLHVPVPPFGLSALVSKNDLGEETQAWSRVGQKRDPRCRHLCVYCLCTAAVTLCSRNLQILQLTPPVLHGKLP